MKLPTSGGAMPWAGRPIMICGSQRDLPNFPLDYFSKFPEAVDAVNSEQAQATAQKYIHPDKIAVVAVGDRSKIESEMKKLNLGKLEIRDPEGKIVQ